MTMTDSETTSGSRTIIANRYEVDLDHPLGVGGMAMVYRGRDLRARRDVAVKTLRPEYQRDPDSRRRFRQEARMMAFVSHPNLVKIYDLHDEASGSWVVMELVPGRNLKQIVEQDGPMSVEQVALVLGQLASALKQVHGHDLVHLDIKPQNIIQMPDGTIKLIDFGLAQPAGPSQDMVGGTAFGTVAYLAPEQASGEAVDAATDVYSLGCVIYELLTGRPPFVEPEGPEQKHRLIRAHLEQLPPAPSEVRPDLNIPSWVDDVIGWSLAKSKRERFHDVATFARMFRSGLEGDVLPATQRTAALPVQRPARQPVRTAAPPPRQPVQDAEEAAEPVDRGPRLGRRVYALGGRTIRRMRGFRRLIWRLALVVALGNVLLAVVLMSQDGPSGLVSRFLSVAPGTTTRVSVDTLNLRSNYGVDSPLIGVLENGTEVQVTGLSVSDEQGRWWPVEVEQDEQTVEGWVWDGGLEPNAWTGRLSWMQDIVERGQSIQRSTEDGIDRIRSLVPGFVQMAVP